MTVSAWNVSKAVLVNAMVNLCDCDEDECNVPLNQRAIHVNGECVHLDGTHHKIHHKTS